MSDFFGSSPELARTSVKSVGIRAVGAVFGFAFNVVLSRSLGVAGTGVVMFYLSFVTMVGLIATGGMDVVGLRELSRLGDGPPRATTTLGHVLANAMLSALTFAMGGFLFFVLIGGSVARADGLWVDALCSLMLFATAFQKILTDWLVALREFVRSQLVYYFLNRMVSLGLALATLALAGASPIRFIGFYAVGLLFAVFYAYRRILAHFSWRAIAKQMTPDMRLLRDGISCGVQNAAFVLLNLSPFVLLGAFSSASQLGEFGISQRLVGVIILVLTTISQFAMREFAQAFGCRDFGALAGALSVSVRLTFLATISLTVPLVMFAHFWVQIFGRDFLSASPVLTVLSLGICAQCLGMPFQAALLVTNNERTARNVTIACAAIGIGLNVIAVSTWGALGTALGTSIGLALQSVGHGVYVFRRLPVHFDLAAFRIGTRPMATGI